MVSVDVKQHFNHDAKKHKTTFSVVNIQFDWRPQGGAHSSRWASSFPCDLVTKHLLPSVNGSIKWKKMIESQAGVRFTTHITMFKEDCDIKKNTKNSKQMETKKQTVTELEGIISDSVPSYTLNSKLKRTRPSQLWIFIKEDLHFWIYSIHLGCRMTDHNLSPTHNIPPQEQKWPMTNHILSFNPA